MGTEHPNFLYRTLSSHNDFEENEGILTGISYFSRSKVPFETYLDLVPLVIFLVNLKIDKNAKFNTLKLWPRSK